MKRTAGLLVALSLVGAFAASPPRATAGLFENVPKKCLNMKNGPSSYLQVECYVEYVGPLLQGQMNSQATAKGQYAQLTSHLRLSWKTPSGVWKDFIICNNSKGPAGAGFKASVCPGQHMVSPADGNYLPKKGQMLRCLGWSMLTGGSASSMVVEVLCQSENPQVFKADPPGEIADKINSVVDRGEATICEKFDQLCSRG